MPRRPLPNGERLQESSPVGCVERNVLRDLQLPAVAVREQAFLVVVELLACLGRELEVRSQDDGVDRAGLLAEAAVDAFHHVDVVAGGPPRAVVAPWPSLDGDGLGRADRLTQLAGDAALLPVRIAPQRKLGSIKLEPLPADASDRAKRRARLQRDRFFLAIEECTRDLQWGCEKALNALSAARGEVRERVAGFES